MIRRAWLKFAILLPWMKVPSSLAGSLITGSAKVSTQPVFAAYIDTLIPADEKTPAATSLGIDHRLLMQAGRSRRQRLLYLQGLQWLHKQALRRGAVSFAVLDDEQRQAIVMQAEAAQPVSLEHTFFEETRDAAMRLYYADPAAWAGLGLETPPQPLGHMDYREPHHHG